MVELLSFVRAVIDLCRHILKYAALAKHAVDEHVADEHAQTSKGEDNDKPKVEDSNDAAHSPAAPSKPPFPYSAYHETDSNQMRKVPFLLLEDSVDTLPIPLVQLF